MIKPTFLEWNLYNKRVFLRADLNVPLAHGSIQNDFRLQAIIPTLDYIINNNGSIVLATHLGRPTYKDPLLSTKILINWFRHRGYSIEFIENISHIAHQPIRSRHIILMENLRFFPGEKIADIFFAKQLAQLAHYYINDAFGLIHRTDCSITELPFEFSEDKRSIGFLIARELEKLNLIKENPSHPFIAFIGGNKIADKIPLLAKLITKVDVLFIYPAICFTFFKALGISVGKSLVDNSMIESCKQILIEAENNNVTIVLPRDIQVVHDSLNGLLTVVSHKNIPNNAIGISIGPQELEQCTKIIKHARTIFLNCAMGFAERPYTQESTKDIIHAMALSSATTVIAGGDSVDYALSTADHTAITYLSSGGGAALAYLSDTLLPGLLPYEDK